VLHTLIIAQALDSGGLGINAVNFFSQLVSFFIIFLVLWRWGFPAITKTLDKRQAIIREGVENAERARQALAEATARAEQELITARREAQEVIEKATKVAEKEANRIHEEAEARAKQFEQQAVTRIQQEAARAQVELSRQIVNLSIAAAGRAISKSVDTNDNRRLVEEFVSTSQAKEQ